MASRKRGDNPASADAAALDPTSTDAEISAAGATELSAAQAAVGDPDAGLDPDGADLAGDLPDPGQYEISADETEAEELDDAADEVPDDTPDKGDPEDVVIDDSEQLDQATEQAAKASDDRPAQIVRKRTVAPVRKTAPTPKHNPAGQTPGKRATPMQFVRQSIAELRKTVWPNGDTVRQYFIVVLVFVVFIMTFVSLLDLGVGELLLKWLG